MKPSDRQAYSCVQMLLKAQTTPSTSHSATLSSPIVTLIASSGPTCARSAARCQVTSSLISSGRVLARHFAADEGGALFALVLVRGEIDLRDLGLHIRHQFAVVAVGACDPHHRVAAIGRHRLVRRPFRPGDRLARRNSLDVAFELGAQHRDAFVGGAEVFALVDVDRALAGPGLPVAGIALALVVRAMRGLAVEVDAFPADLRAHAEAQRLVLVVEVTPAELATVGVVDRHDPFGQAGAAED